MPEAPQRTALPQPADGQPLNEGELNLWSKQVMMLLNQRRRLGTNGTSQAVSVNGRVASAVGDGAAPPEEASLQARLDELNSWRNEALAQLQDMVAQRKGLGADARVVPPTMQSQVTRMARRLLVAASKNAVQIATLEGARRRWYAAAAAAREAIRLRKTATEVIGTAVRPDAQAHLKLAHATFMLEGNSPRLRRELRDAVEQNPKSEGLPYWLARYEVMVGNYPAAREVALRAPNYAKIKNVILPILATNKTQAPQQPFPCNFYTYRYTLVDDDTIRKMQRVLAELANNDQLVKELVGRSDIEELVGGGERLKERAIISLRAMNALLLWNQGLRDFTSGKYASAARNYTDCQREILGYFAERYPQKGFSVPAESADMHSRLANLAFVLIQNQNTLPTHHIWTYFRQRYMALTLDELYETDWVRPTVAPLGVEIYNPFHYWGGSESAPIDVLEGIGLWLKGIHILKALAKNPEKVEEKVDAPLLALALVFTPLAIAEAHRMRRNYDDALTQCNSLLERHGTKKILCEFIEKPFIQILQAQILLDKADSQYKSRLPDESPETKDGHVRYQGLKAAKTYQGVLAIFVDQGEYVRRVRQGAEILAEEVTSLLQHSYHPLLIADGAVPGALPQPTKEKLHRFKTLGKGMPIPTVQAKGPTLAGLARGAGPHEALLIFQERDSQLPPKEANPLIYAIITEAEARLLQLEYGFNYLGYRDDYIPPWRFPFLLERARYFADHAKNAQREYLNFLSNAEREEFQELTVAQAVELEKSNIRIETTRVEQLRLEVEVAKLSQELAAFTENNAQRRLERYQEFDVRADELGDEVLEDANIRVGIQVAQGAVAGASTGAQIGSAIPGVGSAAGAVVGGIVGGAMSFFSSSGQEDAQAAQIGIAAEQREFEKFNLTLAMSEARLASAVASAQVGISRAGLVVAGMQRAAALLRHEFAVQSLNFLRNRTLNAEMWYRLAAMIRDISNTYMRYVVELAFLAEQAYEFEADKRINVIRFDYDVSEVGSLLAADFLLRDLDTLEQDLIVNQQQRQQQTRYILSLAREFPEALQELRDNGSTIFSLRLEQLERRFPGLFNIRIGTVEVTPVALMDPTRFSLEMTYLGASQVRLKAQPDTPPGILSPSFLNRNDLKVGDDWLPSIHDEWPVKIRITGPETTIFSGLTLQERSAIFPFIASSQRNAFEGLGAAASWRIDMSMKENQVVPGTLVDLLLTLTVSGYYDVDLRTAIDRAQRRTTVLTQWLSARQHFADAFYAFTHDGRMLWDVAANLLSLDAPVRNLHNLGIILLPAPRQVQFSPLMSTYVVELDISRDGQVTPLTPIPEIAFSINQLAVTASVDGVDSTDITWDFGEGTGFQSEENHHAYTRPGQYEIGLRLVQEGRLYEYHAKIAVSRTQTLSLPLTAFPSFAPAPPGQTGILASANGSGEEITVIWRVDQNPVERASAAEEKLFELAPGRHVVSFTAVRMLKARIYSQQRFIPVPASSTPLAFSGFSISTNRVFALDGTDTTGSGDNAAANALTEHLFPQDPLRHQRLALSPVDRWTLELSPDDNPFLRSVTSSDNMQVALDEIEDAVLVLEYEIGIS